ncbi:ly6/PLAUR domain-containing protein 5-like isoform X2 [Labeo rohita]|uniref:ly6/PLAUR domain-containing protein 5-like isoform X2 n=1 Tax=Labeo rohita TaxID=84645 RepID=UPI0021E1E27A|nr:ly6/PLAUR domain-containing protein 5-like isoform X2 [Labeo rohita]
MDLQISVFLLFILFTAGHSLSCFNCALGSCTMTTCTNGFTNCLSTTITINSTTVKLRGCAPSVCPTGSLNLGIGKGSSSCCDTDLCNFQDAPDPSTNALNGKSCYYCDGQSCSKTVSCSGTEDRCFNATVTTGLQPQVFKGCVSKSFCDATTSIPNVGSLSCCEGNLCNSAKSVTQSFLFLCCSLLSFILLH